jgi:hypothetical protein
MMGRNNLVLSVTPLQTPWESLLPHLIRPQTRNLANVPHW